MKEFFADESLLNSEEYLFFTYYFETDLNPNEAASHLCQETSTAQWKRPNVDEDFRPLYGAKVVSLDAAQNLVRIAHPIRNFGTKIPNLLTVACGEGAFFCPGIKFIKLLDIDFPDSYLADFEGPQFGMSGLREILNIHDRPIFFGVVKPNIGLCPADFGRLALDAWLGGLDAAKDDEMLGDTSWSPFDERVKILGKLREDAQQNTGVAKMFIANITDEVDRLIAHHDTALKNGVNAVMINGMTTGFSAVRWLRKHAKIPLIGHFDLIASCSRMPNFGISTEVFTKLQRLCGFDAIIMPGFGKRMMTPDEEVRSNCAECVKPFGKLKKSLPVPGGSDWAGTLPIVHERLGTFDFGFIPGRGVFGHPDGPFSGARSLHQAWDAIRSKIDLNEYAKEHVELRKAIECFG